MMDDAAGTATMQAAALEVLSRTSSIDALVTLANAMQFSLSAAPLEKTVIAFDANVILRLAAHRRSDDIVDYLRTNFTGRIILPGQVIQEFWNNQFQVVATKSAEIKRKFRDLKDVMEGIDSRFDAFSERFDAVLEEFDEDFGYVFDENTVGKTKQVIGLLQEKALVPFMPRTALAETAVIRKRTKTPPGFKDDLDGDFFVWADLLVGLAQLKTEMPALERVVLVTLDKKVDWSRNGVPHPILSSEISAICGALFETITIDVLAARLLD